MQVSRMEHPVPPHAIHLHKSKWPTPEVLSRAMSTLEPPWAYLTRSLRSPSMHNKERPKIIRFTSSPSKRHPFFLVQNSGLEPASSSFLAPAPMTEMSAIPSDCVRASFCSSVRTRRFLRMRGTSTMSVIRNIPITRKFSLAFAVVCLLCTGLGAYTFFTFRDIAAKSQDVSQASLPSTIQLARIQDAIDSVRRYDLALLLCQSQACEANKNAERLKSITAYDEAIKEYGALVDSQREREQFPKIKDSFARYLEISNRGAALLAAGKKRDASDLNLADSTLDVINEAVVATGECFASNVKDAEDNAAATVRASQRATWINLCATVAIVLLCALTGAVLVGEVAPRLKRLMASMERFAAKDLTATVLVTGTDEIGRVGEAFNTAVASMRSVVQSVAQGAEMLSAASTEISARAVQTASNANTESSKTNQIAAAAQEMTATIGEISHNAESAAQASRLSAETADQGGAGNGRPPHPP